ncbi:MAG TPA: ATP-binding protein [Polyangiaceae bacterium]
MKTKSRTVLHAEQLDDAFRTIAEVLASSTSRDEELHRLVVEKARAIAAGDCAALGFVGGEDGFFARWMISSARHPARVMRAPAADGVLRNVLEARRPIRLNDCSATRELELFPAARSFVGAALRHGEDTLGGVYVTRTADDVPFTDDDALALQRFADRAALVLRLARHRRTAEEAIHARDVVLATVSHDLGNPLGSILMSSATLLRDTPAVDRRRTRPLLDVIRRSAERMRRLIDDLMTAATLESGNFSVAPEVVATRPLLEEAVRLFRPLTDSKCQTLEMSTRDALPDVRCDRERILQVLANLVGNAIKFSPRGSRIRIDAWLHDGEIVISVADTGPGIPADAMPHIFDRHWKGGSDSPGAGLGLYIVREIVRAHGGRVWAESSPGGATFSFALAAQREGPGVARARDDHAPACERSTQ